MVPDGHGRLEPVLDRIIESGTPAGEEVEIDGEAIRAYLSPARGLMDGNIDPLIDHLAGARMIKRGDHVDVKLLFGKELNIKLKPRKRARNFELYAIHVPKQVEFDLKFVDGRMAVTGFESGPDALYFKIKIPVIGNEVYLRELHLDLEDGSLLFEAGVVWDRIAFLGRANVFNKKFEGVDFWASFKKNFECQGQTVF
ncbi:MAG: hypothetical protein A2583_00995 [Bdellovibrionales bacterium RIFOXYD1_FULL_53_11]|nr:MAG: hypothetical protein A2583_00995 [Bdellovibrionales bacterium RIFOXYD1_FULL_53_11]